MRAYYTWLLKFRWVALALLLGLTAWMGSYLWPPEDIRFDFSFNRMFLNYGGDRDQLREYQQNFGDDIGVVSVLFVMPSQGQDPLPAPTEVTGTVFEPRVMRQIVDLTATLAQRKELDHEQTVSVAKLANLHGASIQPNHVQTALERLEDAAKAAGSDWTAQKAVVAVEAGEGPQPPPDLARAVEAYRKAKAAILGHRIYVGAVVAPDGRATAVFGRFKLDYNSPDKRAPLVAELPDIVDQQAGAMPEGSETWITGIPVIERDYTAIMSQELVTYIPIISAVMALLLFVLFRHVHAVVLPMTGVGLATVWSVGFMQQQGEPLNIINNVIPVIVLVIGVAETVHILARYYQISPEEDDKREAIIRAMCAMTMPCFLASLTTAIGFASLISATIPTIRSFGVYSGIAIVAVFVTQVTFLPIGLSLVGRPKARKAAEVRGSWMGRWLDWLSRLVRERSWAVMGGTFVVIAVSVVGISQINQDMRILHELQREHPTAKALYRVQDTLTGLLSHAVTFEGREYPDRRCADDGDCRLEGCDESQCGFRGCCHTQVCKKVDKAWRLVNELREVGLDLTDADELPLYADLGDVVKTLRSRSIVGPGLPSPGGGDGGSGAVDVEDGGDTIEVDEGDGGDDTIEIDEGDGGDDTIEVDEGDGGDDTIVIDDGEEPAKDGPVATTRPAAIGYCAESVKNPALLRGIADLDDWLEGSEEHAALVGRAESIVDLLREMNLSLTGPDDPSNYRLPEDMDRATISQLLWPLSSAGGDVLWRRVTRDYTRANISINAYDAGTMAWRHLKADLEKRLDEVMKRPGIEGRWQAHITGSSTLVFGAFGEIINDMGMSIALAFVFICGLMVLLFRSFRVGLASMLPNVWPIMVTLAMMGFAGIELRVSSVIIFSVALGIAVDDTIHFLHRLREEVRETGGDTDESIDRSLHGSGRAIVLMTIILCVGFFVQSTSTFIAIEQFGLLSAFTLAVALVGDLIVLPAMVKAFKLDRAFHRVLKKPKA